MTTKRTNLERRSASRWAPLLILLGSPALAAGPLPLPHQMAFDRFGGTDGLSSSHVISILQDRRGYLWIGTADGLNRYDGYEIEVFRHDPADTTSIRGNWIAGLREDTDGDLWVLLGIGGLDRFRPESETFEHVTAPPTAPHQPPDRPAVAAAVAGARGSLWLGSTRGLDQLVTGEGGPRIRHHPLPGEAPGAAPAVTAIAPGAGDSLWIGTGGDGLFVRTPAGIGPVAGGDARAVYALLADTTGRVWAGTDRGLATVVRGPGDDEGGHVARLEPRADAALPRAREARTLLEDASGRIWVVFDGGPVARLDPGATAFREVPLPPGVEMRGGGHGRRPALATGDRVWIGTPDGLVVFDPATERFRLHTHDPADATSLPHNAVSHLFADRAGTLWIGTRGGGLAKLDERAARFHRSRNPLADPARPSASAINALTIDGAGRLWLGTDGGLYVIDEPPSSADRPRAPRLGGGILALAVDERGRLWIGHRDGLSIRTEDAAGAVRYRPPPRADLDGVAVRALHRDRAGRMWIGAATGLVCIDTTGAVVTYPSRRDDPRALPSAIVMAIQDDAAGSIWVGTYIGGLSRLDPARGVFEHFVPGEMNRPANQTINSKSVTDLHLDARGRLWIGTYSGGLNRFDPRRRRFEHLTSADGLPGTRVAGILEDDAGHLWISTNAGLARFDPEARIFTCFDAGDGLQSNEFTVGACHRTEGGMLLFGGVEGFNAFMPEEIRVNDAVPPVVLTELRVMDRPARLAEVRGRSHDIELAHDRSFVAFEFAALDFTNPKKNRYAYRLDGLDDDWIQAESRRYAAYTKLDPGAYVFRVKGSNADGVWNEAGLALSVRVVPPFWRTRWFTAIAVGTLVLAGLATHRTITHRRVARTLALERVRVAERERVREEVSRDYHDELGARLTKISLFTELVRRKMPGGERRPAGTGGGEGAGRVASPPAAPADVAAYVETIAQSAESLAHQSRDFIWALNPSKDSLLDVAHYLQEFGADLFAETSVAFHVDGLDPTLAEVRLDMRWKRQITLLFKEALANALRHARADQVFLVFSIDAGHVTISLGDDGTGTPSEGAGTSGSGLENMRARAAEIGGTLHVQASPGQGTCVTLVARLPEEA